MTTNTKTTKTTKTGKTTKSRKPKPTTNKNTKSKYSQNPNTPKGSKNYQNGKTSLTTLLLRKIFDKPKTRRKSTKKLNLLNGAGRALLLYFAFIGLMVTLGGTAETVNRSLNQIAELQNTTVELVRGDR